MNPDINTSETSLIGEPEGLADKLSKPENEDVLSLLRTLRSKFDTQEEFLAHLKNKLSRRFELSSFQQTEYQKGLNTPIPQNAYAGPSRVYQEVSSERL